MRRALVACALVLLPLQARASPSLRELGDKIQGELEAWDIEGAQGVLEEIVAADARSTEAAYFRGRVLFEQGKYAEAAAALTEARAQDESERIDEDLRLAKAAAEEVKGDDVHESAHFVLRTPAGKDALLVPYALAGLEKAYAALTQDLGFAPRAKIRVEVYESAQALARVSPLTVAEIKASGTIALCKYNRLMITTPRALLRGYPWLDTLSHEFTHYLVTKKGRNTVPIWLQEGLAKFLETRWRGAPGLAVDDLSLQLLLRAARGRTLIPFAKMHPSIAKLPTQEQAALAFAEVEAAIRLLYLRGGQTALTELVAAMAQGFGDEQAVAQAYGKSFAQFEADWRDEVAKPRKDRAPARPHVQHRLVFKEDAKKARHDPSAPEGADEVIGSEAASSDAEARRAARLGELLFVRRRWGAAALEYERARARLPAEVPQIARRYAFAQIQVGKFPEAEAALKSATARDPEDEASQALLAGVLAKRGAFGDSRAALDAGLAEDPFDPQLHAIYVEVARGLKDKPLEDQERAAYALSTGGQAQHAAPPAKAGTGYNPSGDISAEPAGSDGADPARKAR